MRIIHVFRGAVGGLFRHVCDQVEGQAAAGHEIGIICDSLTGGASALEKFAQLAPYCNLGIERLAMLTLPSLSDLRVIAQTMAMAKRVDADILHGHGAKGGLYARLTARRLGLASAYVPHGGSLHYEWRSLKGAIFLSAEKALRVERSGLIFVCEFERNLFARKIGLGACPSAVIYNGLGPNDFKARALSPHATDFLFVGEMRVIKGIDILLRAVAQIEPDQRPTLTLIGEGPQEVEFKALAGALGITAQVTFAGRKPMAEAMRMGRVLVVPSRRESFPYVVIEAMAAGIPLIAANVGGIVEALPIDRLVPADDVAALAARLITEKRGGPDGRGGAEKLRHMALERFSVKRMVSDTLAFYERLI